MSREDWAVAVVSALMFAAAVFMIVYGIATIVVAP